MIVIGDHDKDIKGAKENGCNYHRCPEYTINDERKFSFTDIDISKINMALMGREKEESYFEC